MANNSEARAARRQKRLTKFKNQSMYQLMV